MFVADKNQLSPLFPTCVGMNRKGELGVLLIVTVPHMRGDEPSTQLNRLEHLYCSPHAWG